MSLVKPEDPVAADTTPSGTPEAKDASEAKDTMDTEDAKEESTESLRELRERAMAQYTSIGEEKQRMQRLNFLLEKSAAYVSFVSKRLEDKRTEKRQVKQTAKRSRTPATRRNAKKPRVDEKSEADSAVQPGEDVPRVINGESVSPRQPRTISGGVMKEYQLEGMEWLASLYENGLNGILADEMGLGKTLQTISFLAYLRERQVWGPFLVLCPLSTLSNWASEFYRFAPQMPVLVYHGVPEERRELRRKHLRQLGSSFPVVLTTYEISMRDKMALQRLAWKFIVVDEGHRIKNMSCKLIRDLKSYQSSNRLLLTGTPLQNSLAELWSLLNFLLPDIFDDLDSFQAWFDFDDLSESRIISQEASSSVISKLHQILQPFLLRRLKSDVEKHLPPKREYLITCPMAPLQYDYYQAVRRAGADKEPADKESVDKESVDKESVDDADQTLVPNTPTEQQQPSSRGKQVHQKSLCEEAQRFIGEAITDKRRAKRPAVSYKEAEEDDSFDLPEDEIMELPAAGDEGETSGPARLHAAVHVRLRNLQFQLMQQRKVCQHPYLFDFPVTDPTDPESPYLIDEQLVRASGKLLVLDRLLPELFARGHRVLIFSQFSRVLDILECYAELRKWRFCRIDGSVGQVDRQAAIVKFNTDEDIPLFFLTTRSGGLGINLTSADTVVIFDSDWNPQQDLQAQDRVHRIGQQRPVIIYRLIIAGSCEGGMLACAKAKRKLEKLVIHERKFKGVGAQKREDVADLDIKRILMDDDVALAERDQRGLRKVLESLSPDEKVPADIIISDRELEALLDRSPEAYANPGASLSSAASSRIAHFEQAPDERNDMLASHGQSKE
ncbi:putative ATPase [Coemansia sp. RSA 2336]|nr:putative ATPase [Coemansia sp. RSA 2336]